MQNWHDVENEKRNGVVVRGISAAARIWIQPVETIEERLIFRIDFAMQERSHRVRARMSNRRSATSWYSL